MTEDPSQPEGLSEEESNQMIKADAEQLAELEPKMMEAMSARAEGKDGAAKAIFEDILKAEPRLAEPRLELAHIAAVAEDWDEAQTQARLAVDILRRGGQWTEDVEPRALLAFALNLLGELIVRTLEEGDLFLTDRARFQMTWNEAAAIFDEALEVDPECVEARRNRTRYRKLEPDN